MSNVIKADDYARLHVAFPEDTDLEIVADKLDDEYEAGYLVALYWTHMITRAKAAKSFGWFETTPRKLAEAVRDRSPWGVRQRLWQLLAESGSIRVRQGVIDAPSVKVDVLLVKWEKWQVDTTAERKKRERERARIAAGKGVHWTLAHLDEFCDVTAVRRDMSHGTGGGVTKPAPNVTPQSGGVTTHDTTRHNETKEGARESRPLPPTVLETINLVREIPGMSRWQLESNVRKAMQQYPSLPDEAVCEAITAFEARLPEGKAIHSEKAWRTIRNCFDVARKRLDEKSKQQAAEPTRRRSAAELLAEQDRIWNTEVAS